MKLRERVCVCEREIGKRRGEEGWERKREREREREGERENGKTERKVGGGGEKERRYFLKDAIQWNEKSRGSTFFDFSLSLEMRAEQFYSEKI